MADANVNVQVSTSADTAGVDQASQSVSGFSDQLDNLAAVAGGVALEHIAEQILQIGESAVESISKLEDFTTSLGIFSSGFTSSMGNANDAIVASGKGASTSAEEAADALITYTERVSALNDKIKEIMAGQNVIDEQTAENDALETLAQNHADKILSIQEQITNAQDNEVTQELNRATSMNNTLADMKSTQANKMADLEEKRQAELEDATNQIAKNKINKEYDDQEKLATDSFNRSYTTKQSELQRNMDQQNAADKATTEKQIATYQEAIDTENAAYTKKAADEKAIDDKRIADLKTKNDKELDMYKQQLADEERAYKLHVDNMAAAGAAAADMSIKLQDIDPASAFARTADSVHNLLPDIMGIVNAGSPFPISDILQYAQIFTDLDINYQEMIPIISDFAAANNVGFGQAAQAMVQATQGQVRGLANSLGIPVKMLQEFGAQTNSSGQLKDITSLVNAFKNIDQTPMFKGQSAAKLADFSGAVQDAKNKALLLQAGFVGVNAETGKTSGIFEDLGKKVHVFSDWITSNKGTIEGLGIMLGAVAGVITVLLIPALVKAAIVGVGTLVTNIAAYIVQGWVWIGQMATQALALLGIDLAAAPVIITIGLIALAIASVILIGYELITHWQNVKAVAQDVWNMIGNVVQAAIQKAAQAFDWLSKAIKSLSGGKIDIGTLSFTPTYAPTQSLSDAYMSPGFTPNALENSISSLFSGAPASGSGATATSPGSSGSPVTMYNYNTFNDAGGVQAYVASIQQQIAAAQQH